MLAIRQELQAMQPQCEDKIAEIKEKLYDLMGIENIQMSKRQEAYARYITGRYTIQEYKRVVNKFPLPTLQINQLQAELKRLEKTRKTLCARMSALCCQDLFELLLKEQLRQIVVSRGIVSRVVFI